MVRDKKNFKYRIWDREIERIKVRDKEKEIIKI